jgi:hypothetical protein
MYDKRRLWEPGARRLARDRKLALSRLGINVIFFSGRNDENLQQYFVPDSADCKPSCLLICVSYLTVQYPSKSQDRPLF